MTDVVRSNLLGIVAVFSSVTSSPLGEVARSEILGEEDTTDRLLSFPSIFVMSLCT